MPLKALIFSDKVHFLITDILHSVTLAFISAPVGFQVPSLIDFISVAIEAFMIAHTLLRFGSKAIDGHVCCTSSSRVALAYILILRNAQKSRQILTVVSHRGHWLLCIFRVRSVWASIRDWYFIKS